MCGIAGLMMRGPDGPEEARLRALGDRLVHRGPDGRGLYRVGNVGMVQTRLAIIDLAGGSQPLREPAGAALIANGEIYNYRELRAAMPGAPFATDSDCEPPLHLYRTRGAEFSEALRGMYAIALHDPAEGNLYLARDPFGIKPLYYVETELYLAFASEPQALIGAGLAEARLVEAVRDELLQLQFTTGRQTIYAQIQRVLPGETLTVSNGRIVARRRRAALPEGGPLPMDEDAADAALDAALEESVALHQRSDVPYAMFLSGGIDSAALLTLMARLNNRPVRAFTAGFVGADVPDERAAAAATARALGAEHVEVAIGEEDLWSALPAIAAAMDDPAADYAVLPTYLLAREARRDFKVILCGEGGDELFAGYGRYRTALRPWWWGGRMIRRKGSLHGLDVVDAPSPGWRDGIAAAEAVEAQPGRSRLQIAQAVDCADWLPNDLLTKLDRCLMAHGVEGRTPFLDSGVAAMAFRLPDRLKVRDGMGKWILRRWLAKRLPAARPFERKRGFTVPVAQWIARRGDELGPLVAAAPGIAETCRPEAVRRLFQAAGRRKQAGFAAWTLLFYALWHRRHILGAPVGGDVFECLMER